MPCFSNRACTGSDDFADIAWMQYTSKRRHDNIKCINYYGSMYDIISYDCLWYSTWELYVSPWQRMTFHLCVFCKPNLHYSVSMLVIGTVIIIFFMLICFCRFSPCIHFLYLIVHFGVIIMLQVWKNSNGTCQNSRTNAQPKCLLLVYLLTANVIFDLQSCCSLKLFFFFSCSE